MCRWQKARSNKVVPRGPSVTKEEASDTTRWCNLAGAADVYGNPPRVQPSDPRMVIIGTVAPEKPFTQ